MNLLDIVKRDPAPQPWSEGEKIPWNDHEFSKRMLDYHLSQDHDLASRRFSVIDKHVKFIDRLAGGPTKVLDLGSGPGFYCSRLTDLGYRCKGIDFGPASIQYAKEKASEAGQDIEYVCEDIRTTEYGGGYGLVLMVYGEFNVFRESDIRLILGKAYDSLEEGGLVITEPHTFKAIKGFGESPASWYSSESALFSDKPHIVLFESFWNEKHRATINRHIVIDASTGETAVHADAMQAYTNEEYEGLLHDAGFSEVEYHRSLTGDDDASEHLMVLVARK